MPVTEHRRLKLNEYSRKREPKRREYMATKEAEYRRRNRIKALRHSVRQNAVKNHLVFDLSLEWFEQHLAPMKCEATGVQLSWDEIRGPWLPSVDKINPGGDYTPDNCRVTCWLFNRAKSHWSDADMLLMAEGLVSMASAPA